MHQKKSEVQIGKESSGVSSDFNPAPPLLHQTHNFHSTPLLNLPRILIAQSHPQDNDPITPTPLSSTPKTTPHKRPLLTQANPNPNTAYSSSNSISKSPTFSTSLHQYAFPPTLTSSEARIPPSSTRALGFNFLNRSVTKETALGFLRPLQHLGRLRIHLRLILLLSLPFFYFLLSHPSHSFVLDFLSAFAFSAALFFSLNLALPRLPSICLFLSRSFHIKLSSTNHGSRSPLPVFWSIGSKPEQKANSGCWVEVYGNGDVYEGEFHNGKCSGCGIYYYYMSGRYEGDWIDGKYDGFGVETWARGSRYRGQYSKGLRHGFGVYRFYTGDAYAGEWSHGQSHGCGVHTCEDGSRYVGEFKWGVKHGPGHYHFRNGDVYAGEYFADRMHGFGVYRFGNGHRYEGAWHEGKRQGLGMYTFRNGETQSGHWNNGILDVPSTQNNSYPVSPVGVYHSKVLNAVQGARRAAEKAYQVAKVDERVNRAVVTANIAANAGRVAAVKAVQTQMHYSGKNGNNIPMTTM